MKFVVVVFLSVTCRLTRAFAPGKTTTTRARAAATIRSASTIQRDTWTVSSLERAIDATLARQQDPVPLLQQLEALEDDAAQPNRSPAFLGDWHVWWTNCPPPSNGQLGPFTGTSEQTIGNFESGSYQNILRVPPGDWLMAVLDGIYEDWDGTVLGNGNSDAAAEKVALPANQQAWGDRHWKVTFVKLTISVFGFPLVQKEFPPETARVWRTTFMRDDIRIVRAGKTGRVEDEVIFYTKRRPKKL